VHINTVNLGQTKSLNIGLGLSKGSYIAINDADDLSLPRRLEKQIDFLNKNPEVAVVGASAYIMDKSGRIKRSFPKSTDIREIIQVILNDTPVIHGSVLMNREIIVSQGGYDEEYRICQDYALWSSLIRKGFKIANIPEKLVVIRHYMDSISFKESDAQTLENGKIIYENIRAMTSLNITLDDAISQRMFFAAPERLKRSDFNNMEELFIKEHENFKNVSIDSTSMHHSLKAKMIKPFSKLAIFEFNSGNQKEARRIAGNYIKRYGFSTIPFMIWMASYISKYVLDAMLFCYEKLQEISVKHITVNCG
jgi:glycosyltransferase involved in cell wall biosynthesis